MSQENVESVLALYAGWNAGDMEAVREQLDPRIVVWNPPDFPEPGPFIGPEGVIRQWEQQRETYQSDALEPITEPIHAADRVVIRFIWHGTGEGPQADIEVTGVYAVRGGRVSNVEHFWSHAEALEAAGLRAPTNLDLVRSISADWQSGDYSSAEWAHPNIEYVIADGPTPGSWTGLSGMAEGFRAFASAWEQYRVEPAEHRELDGERVLVLFHPSGRGKTSGLELGQVGTKTAGLFHIREGRVRKLVFYMDGDRALADLGLSGQDAHADS